MVTGLVNLDLTKGVRIVLYKDTGENKCILLSFL